MKIKIKDGVKDITPYNENGDYFDFSGFTAHCSKKEYESRDGLVLVTFDRKSLERFPQKYIDHADEEDEDYTRYCFNRDDLIVIDDSQK